MTKAIVAAVQRQVVSDEEFDASLTELRQLAKTLGFEVVATFTQKRAAFEAGAYFGTGKREELKLLREEHAAELILIDHEISPSQAFNLAQEVGGEVMDRTMVILEIFHRHASSKFARAQVETGRAAAPAAGAAASRTASSTGARSATAWPSCRRTSTP
jgi:GTP-binding protein HflX